MICDTELIQIRGGTKLAIVGAIAAVITFIIGIIDGIVRPLECNK